MLRSRNKSSPFPALDLSVVPTDVFSLRGNAFYELLERITSEDIKDLLKIQRISTARCFLDTNPLAFFDLHCDDPLIVQIQNRLSFKIENNINVVYAGVVADLRYLKRLFETFLMKHAKEHNKQVDRNITIDSSQSNPSTTMTPLAVPVHSPQISNLSATEHHDYLTKQIDSWWETHRSQYDLENSRLIESDDYQLNIKNDSVIVKCSCKRNIRLSLLNSRRHYQLSNFYKHLTQSSHCTIIRRKQMPLESGSEDESLSSSSSSTCSTPSRRSATTKKRKTN